MGGNVMTDGDLIEFGKMEVDFIYCMNGWLN